MTATASPTATTRVIAGIAVAVITAALALALVEDTVASRVLAIAGACLSLWLFEVVPAFVPTLLLLAGVPLVLGGTSPLFSLPSLLKAAADPVMALFFGGFVLAAAARRHGLDAVAARAAVRFSRGRRRTLIVTLAAMSAFLSMWLSNIAAAAMLVQLVRPLLDAEPKGSPFRRAALLAIAFGANFGGMATPIGSGPNAIAVASVPGGISFARWLVFSLPLTVLMVASAVAIIVVSLRIDGGFTVPLLADATTAPRPRRAQAAVLSIFLVSVIAWLTEPWHGIPAAVVALAAAAFLFAASLVEERELKELDWSTLLLIAGGIVLGRVLESSGLLARAVDLAVAAELSATLALAVFIAAAAILSALMSNTATATVLVPLAMAAIPSTSTAILIAIACSLGAPFAISTPPNAMAFGAGVRAKDLLLVGLPLMLVGCAIIATTGPAVLAVFGVGKP